MHWSTVPAIADRIRPLALVFDTSTRKFVMACPSVVLRPVPVQIDVLRPLVRVTSTTSSAGLSFMFAGGIVLGTRALVPTVAYYQRHRRYSRGSGRWANGMCGGAADINWVQGLLGRHVCVVPVDGIDLVTMGCRRRPIPVCVHSVVGARIGMMPSPLPSTSRFPRIGMSASSMDQCGSGNR